MEHEGFEGEAGAGVGVEGGHGVEEAADEGGDLGDGEGLGVGAEGVGLVGVVEVLVGALLDQQQIAPPTEPEGEQFPGGRAVGAEQGGPPRWRR